MPVVSARVDVSTAFPRISQEVNALAQRAVAEAAREGAQAARAVASRRSRSGRMAAISPSSVQGTPDGWGASFASPVHYAWFQNYGTLGNRRKALKRAPSGRRSRAPGTGIEPLGFLEAGRKAGLAAMKRVISAGL